MYDWCQPVHICMVGISIAHQVVSPCRIKQALRLYPYRHMHRCLVVPVPIVGDEYVVGLAAHGEVDIGVVASHALGGIFGRALDIRAFASEILCLDEALTCKHILRTPLGDSVNVARDVVGNSPYSD